jgi:very-short-patch-repair endonuclease
MQHITGAQSSNEALLTQQYGVISRRQAFDGGLTRRQVGHRLASGEWVRVLPGVYRATIVPPSLRQRAMAAVLWSAPDGLVSHLTAGALWRLDDVAAERVHVLLPRSRRLKSDDVVVHRTGDLLPADIGRLGPIPVTSPLRTVIDLAAVLDADALEVAIESALRRGLFSPGQLRWRAGLLLGTGRPGSETLRRLLDQRGLGRSASAPEVDLGRLLEQVGFGRPERQYVVRAQGRFVARVDLAYPEHRIALEYDSDRWHAGVRRRHADAQRRNRLRAVGWTVIEVTPDHLRDPEPLLATLRTLLAA